MSKKKVALPGLNWAAILGIAGLPIALGVFLIWLSRWLLETYGPVSYTSDVTGRTFIPDAFIWGAGIGALSGGVTCAGYVVIFVSSFIRSSRVIGPNDIVFPVVRNGKGFIKAGEFRYRGMRSRSLPNFMTARLEPESFELWDGQGTPMWSVPWAEVQTATIIKAFGPPYGPLLTLTGSESTTLIAVFVLSRRNLFFTESNRTTLATLRAEIDRLIRDASDRGTPPHQTRKDAATNVR